MAEISSNSVLSLAAVGDVSPNREDPPSMFRHCRDALKSSDIVFGQMENALSDRGTPMFVPYSPSKLAAKNASALTEAGAGFHVMSFACNHAMDYGWEAFHDTLDILRQNHIQVVGAGKNIAEARTPAIIERKGTKVGFLGYLSVATPGLIAQDNIPGCAPLMATTSYQLVHFSPGMPPLVLTQLFPDQKKAMEEDIRKLRPKVDILVVSIHAGIISVRAMIAMYQKEAAHAAIDAGADLVLQHHAHILKGIEVYNNKAIFYGLGNFGIEHGLPFPGRLKAWDPGYRSPSQFLRVKPAPGWKRYPYHPDARNAIIAKAYIKDKKIDKIGFVPAYINPDAEPEVLSRSDPRAQGVLTYLQQISDEEDLKLQLSWDGNEVLVG
ncbi:MAG: CapA family protein [Chloroflexi bacterium]|nr:CapA family protein [Chloroflexota bacterium]